MVAVDGHSLVPCQRLGEVNRSEEVSAETRAGTIFPSGGLRWFGLWSATASGGGILMSRILGTLHLGC